jgi:hypothetical protein
MKPDLKRTPYKWTPKARAVFLREYGERGRVDLACQAVGLSRSGAYRLRGKSADFARDWKEAKAVAVSVLEDEARRRAVDGVDEPLVSNGRLVTDEHGKPVTVRRYSDKLMVLLLKGAKPGIYHDNAAGALNGGGTADITRDDVTIVRSEK